MYQVRLAFSVFSVSGLIQRIMMHLKRAAFQAYSLPNPADFLVLGMSLYDSWDRSEAQLLSSQSALVLLLKILKICRASQRMTNLIT
jgi:hypothetical protein